MSGFVNQASKLVDTEVMEPVRDVEDKEDKRKYYCGLLIPVYLLKKFKAVKRDEICEYYAKVVLLCVINNY